MKKYCLLLALTLLATLYSFGQSLQHPIIWTTPDEKTQILSKIQQYTWAQSIVNRIKNTIDDLVNTHQTNPAAILNTIPTLASDDNLSESAASSANSKHVKILNYASYAGMLYYLTNDEKYAQFGSDILWYYIEALAPRYAANTAISGNKFYDARCSYLHFAIAYDFLVNYLKATGTKVYQKSSGQRIPFDNNKAQKAVRNIARNALQEHSGSDTKYGKTVSNHPILRAPGVLFSILCVEDDAERERLFKVFWETGTKEQNSFTKTILPMFGEQGIWPESVSYSFMPNVTLILNVVDRLYPEKNVLNGHLNILDGNFLFDYLRHPNRRFVRYGDSHRDNDPTQTIYRYTLNLAQRRNLTKYVQQATTSLQHAYRITGGFKPAVPVGSFDNVRAFEQLFWGTDIPLNNPTTIDYNKPTVIIKHAGVALQRNATQENNETYGLCGIIGGAHYVHSHCTGITMELYGAGYIMAANAGLPKTLAERSSDEHRKYFWRHAGNNTMIVNGTTHGIQAGAWNSNSYLWQNTTENIAAEPAHLEDPISPNFSFATQKLNDEVNNCVQQRTLSTIRTSETSGYYFDLFRSKSLSNNNFHDYIYHNLGDVTHIMTLDGNELSVTPTTRYQNDIGDPVQSPGWRFFENTQVTSPVNDAVHIRFDLNETNTYMNLFVPQGVTREYTKALGPATREAKGSYLNKKTQIVAIRQNGEAWNRPYVHIFEPSISENTSVKSVEYLYRDQVIVGAKVVSVINNKEVTDYIICQEDNLKTVDLTDIGLKFTGHFAIVRQEKGTDKNQLTLYIGQGQQLSFGNYTLNADSSGKGLKVVEQSSNASSTLGFMNLKNHMEIPRGIDLAIEALVGSAYSEVSCFANGINLGTRTTAPFTWTLTNPTAPSYLIQLIAKDATGVQTKRSITLFTPSQTPRTTDGHPHPIPGTLEAENYDLGQLNEAYYDRSNQNTSKYSYHNNDLVDLSKDQSKVVYIQGNEWLEYTIWVNSSGYYDFYLRHTTRRQPQIDNALSLSFPDENYTICQNVALKYTGSNIYTTQKIATQYLEEGKHILRMNFGNYGFDIDNLEITSSTYTDAITKEIPQNKIRIYPNPANNYIYIDLPQNIRATIQIFSLNGKLIQQSNSPGGKTSLSIPHELKNGIYAVHIDDGNYLKHIQKLVINKSN